MENGYADQDQISPGSHLDDFGHDSYTPEQMAGIMDRLLPNGCPECGSFDIRVEPFDFGRDSETGYSDSGERHICRACGHTEIL